MKKIIFPVLFILLIAGCKEKSSSTSSNDEKIAGQTEKTWIATRETNSDGEKNKLTRDEKKEKITFWRNGNVKMGNDDQSMSGQWSYEGSTLTLHFAGENVTENFTVVELSDNRLQLKAGDGSELIMKPS